MNKESILRKDNNWTFFGIISLILFVGRIISFRENSLDPDELEWMYDIRRCLEDPRPFVGFDAHTSGPFAIYILSIFKLLTTFSKLYQLRLITFFFFILPSLLFISKIAQKGTSIIAMLTFGILVSSFNVPFFGQSYDGIFSYNTEYLIMIFCAIMFWILRNGSGNFMIIFFAFILFILPFVKLQALPLTAIFGILFLIKLLNTKKVNQVALLIGAYIFFNGIWFSYLYFDNLFDDFYFAYIEKNFDYMASNDFGQESINPINFFNRFNSFYGFLWIFIILFWYQLFSNFRTISKVPMFEIILIPQFQSLLVLVVAIISIIMGKNDYGHYYILLFVPASIFVADILKSSQQFAPIFYIILLVNFNFTIFGSSCLMIFEKLGRQSDNKLIFGKPFSILVNSEMKEWLLANKVPKASILSLGWTQSQAMYYILQDDFDIIYRSSHCSYYERSFRVKNTYMFQREERALFEDLNKKMPYFIVDTWELVTKFKGTALPEFVAKHYELKLKRKDFTIYQLKKQ